MSRGCSAGTEIHPHDGNQLDNADEEDEIRALTLRGFLSFGLRSAAAHRTTGDPRPRRIPSGHFLRGCL